MDNSLSLILAVAIPVVIFLVFRHLFCWYWKINQRLEMQEDALAEQKKQTEILEKLYIEQCASKAYLEAMVNNKTTV